MNYLYKNGLPRIKGVGTMILMIAMSMLFFYHHQQPKFLTGWLLGLRVSLF